MKEDIKIPSMGESITEATVCAILKPSGTPVKADEEILELETDKINQVLYAPSDGVITFSVTEEDVVEIGQVVGFIDTSAEAPKKKEDKKEEKKKKEEVASKPTESAPPVKKPKQTPAPGVRHSIEEFITDLKEPTQTIKPVVTQTAVHTPHERREKMTKIRQVIAKRLVESQQTTAMLTTFNEVDMSAVMSLRANYKESFEKKHGVKLGFMSFFVKACVAALKAFPEVNAWIDGDEIVYHDYQHVGIAISSPRGLIVPVLRNCEQLSFAQVEQNIRDYAIKARSSGLTVDDLTGGTFTVTNGGTFGSLLSTPILNPPQSGILGMHKIEKRAVVVGDQIVIKPMMYVALSYDHRIVDGKEAVSFLVTIKEALEDPSRLLIDI